MTIEDKMSRIVDRLLERTRSQELTWETTALRLGFITNFTDSSIRLFVDEEKGELAVSAIDNHGRTFQTESASRLTNKDSLYELYELARRQALGVDEKLGAILEKLEAPSTSPAH